MAEKQFTLLELQAMTKPKLQELGESLHLQMKGLSKPEMIDRIIGENDDETEIEQVEKGILSGVTNPTPQSPSKNTDIDSSWQFQLEMRKLDLEHEAKRMLHEQEMARINATTHNIAASHSHWGDKFRVDNATKLLPKLVSENEIDTYLVTFEKIALLQKWPKNQWVSVLQTQLRGKGLKVFAELSLADCADYDKFKHALLIAYELCSEVYRKRFRAMSKTSSDTYADLAFKLNNTCKRWLQSVKAYDNVELLREVMLMEQFVNTLPNDLKLWIIDQKCKTVDEMARAADQYTAVRKAVSQSEEAHSVSNSQTQNESSVSLIRFNNAKPYKWNKETTYQTDYKIKSDNRKDELGTKHNKTHGSASNTTNKGLNKLKPPFKCFYCGKPNHVSAECRKRIADEMKPNESTEPSLLINQFIDDNFDASRLASEVPVLPLHPLFLPYTNSAFVIDDDNTAIPIRTLRDTGALQSVIRESVVPASALVNTGQIRLLKGIANEVVEVPLVELHLQTDFMDEKVLCGVIPQLPDGVDFLLGNDIWAQSHPSETDLFYNAVVTRSQTAMARSFDTKSFSTLSSVEDPKSLKSSSQSHSNHGAMIEVETAAGDEIHQIDLKDITSAADFQNLQQQDPSLKALFEKIEDPPYPISRSYYFLRDGILMHHESKIKKSYYANQLVAPRALRSKLLALSHDIPAAGHLGVAKSKARLIPHFFWPKMTKEITAYVRSCDICQRVGKGNKPHRAPLIPLPVISEPFSRIAIDIVGPLPVCPKTGNRFILTVLDLATHYPEAIPLLDHTAQRVATALAGVFSHFGFPEECLSDLGSEFMSELMQIFMQDFKITQIRCSAYHPETNGACERFHRTLKSMIRSLTTDFKDGWDECLPWILFAYREVPMETTGYSPFESLFGREVRGPLGLLKSSWKPTTLHKAKPNVIQFMLDLREKLKQCHDIALKSAEQAAEKSKVWYDKKARDRSYEPGQLVLVCLPLRSSPLEAKYCGPYRILQRLGPVNYLVATPNRRKIQRVCHINMLKPYVERQSILSNTVLMDNDIDSNTGEAVLLSELSEANASDMGPSASDVDPGFALDHLEPEQKSQLKTLLLQYADIFNDMPGRTTLCSHSIQLLEGAKPFKLPPYRVHPEKTELIKQELELMLRIGVIEPSCSPFASPVVIVSKPDGKSRFCTDFRRLNSLTIPDGFPMQRIDDLIDKVGQAKFLTKIDLSRGYWQVPMEDSSIPLSAFVTSHGHFQWRYMPFGLRNAPATFQRLVNRVLAGLESFTGSFLDDIIIFSSSWSDHIRHIQQVFDRIRSAGLTIKKSKCVFATAEVDFLGHRVGLGKVEPRRQTVQALLDFPRPNNQKQLRSYLGLAGYYRKFIPHFAQLAVSLTNLLRKGMKFEWTPEAEAAFVDLKSRLASQPILRPPDFKLPFCIAVDASAVALGANIFQVIEGIEHPIAYYSKRLNIHQQRYSTVEQEALALITACRVFSVYFGSQPITVYSDHSPLQFIQKMANYNQKLLRWSLELQQYNLTIKHRAGKNNLIPDILSRPSV